MDENKWIDVNIKLPKNDDWVLAAIFESGRTSEYWLDAYTRYYDDYDDSEVDGMWSDGNPSHWKPLNKSLFIPPNKIK